MKEIKQILEKVIEQTSAKDDIDAWNYLEKIGIQNLDLTNEEIKYLKQSYPNQIPDFKV